MCDDGDGGGTRLRTMGARCLALKANGSAMNAYLVTRLRILEVEGRASESAFVGRKPAMDFIFRCRHLRGLRLRNAGHLWHVDALVP